MGCESSTRMGCSSLNSLQKLGFTSGFTYTDHRKGVLNIGRMVFIKDHQRWLTGKFLTTWRHQMGQSSANCWLLEDSQIKWIRWNLFAQPEGIWKHLGDGYEHMLYNIRTYHDNEIDERMRDESYPIDRSHPHWGLHHWDAPLQLCSFKKTWYSESRWWWKGWNTFASFYILFYFTQSTMYDTVYIIPSLVIYLYTNIGHCNLQPSDFWKSHIIFIFSSAAAPLPRKQLWEVNVLPANLMNAPAIYQGSVFTSDTSGAVRAVSMQTGKPVWFTNTSKAICQDNGSLGHLGPWLPDMVNIQKAIGNGHRNNPMKKMVIFHGKMLVHQRVSTMTELGFMVGNIYVHGGYKPATHFTSKPPWRRDLCLSNMQKIPSATHLWRAVFFAEPWSLPSFGFPDHVYPDHVYIIIYILCYIYI